MPSYETKDSGKRKKYSTGAQRDDASNKPSYGHLTKEDWETIGNPGNILLPLSRGITISAYKIGVDTSQEIYTGYDSAVELCPVRQQVIQPSSRIGVSISVKVRDGLVQGFRDWLISDLLVNRLQALLQRGARKYTPWNWRKGLPLVVCFNSAIRHLIQWRLGDRSEDHLAAAAANIMFMMDIENAINNQKLPRHLITKCGVLKEKREK